MSVLAKVERAGILNEGYDYEDIVLIDSNIYVFYEHGIVNFNDNFESEGFLESESVLVKPDIDENGAVYDEIEGRFFVDLNELKMMKVEKEG